MGKHKGRTEAVRERRSRALRRRLVAGGFFSLAVLAGVATWYVYPRSGALSAAIPYQGGPRLAVDREEIDLGTARFDTRLQVRFLLRNVGDQPLKVAANPRVEAVEGC